MWIWISSPICMILLTLIFYFPNFENLNYKCNLSCVYICILDKDDTSTAMVKERRELSQALFFNNEREMKKETNTEIASCKREGCWRCFGARGERESGSESEREERPVCAK